MQQNNQLQNDVKFIKELKRKIRFSLWNNYTDNHDHYRFGPQKKDSVKFKFTLSRYLEIFNFKSSNLFIEQSPLGPYLHKLNMVYQLLSDKQSQKLFVQLCAYRILGKSKVKLPLCKPAYWKKIEEMKSYIKNKEDVVQLKFMNWQLFKFNLDPIGLPFTIYFTPKGVFTEFFLRQYEYRNKNISCSVQEGDVVIDAGGCWGDTALLFASQVGNSGKVYSFEFLPSNLQIMRRNIALNPNLSRNITLVDQPLWEAAEKKMYYSENGPGSQVSFEKFIGNCNTIHTISIDSYVEQNNILKVNFIKMDIEGAEPFALKGALNTIRRFKPKLAVCIYHNLDDFSGIAKQIDALGLGYKFYLGHYSIHSEETVLYAV